MVSSEEHPGNSTNRSEVPVDKPKASADKDFSKGLLNREAVIKSAEAVTTKKYPNADDVVVDDYSYSVTKRTAPLLIGMIPS